MSSETDRIPHALREPIVIPKSPEIPSELTMRKYRIVIEDEKTEQEFVGFSGLNRVAVQRIVALIHSVGAHELQIGRLPTGKNAGRKLSQWARDVAHVLDRKPPKPAPATRAHVVRHAREGR